MIGRRLGHYEITSRLGTGGMGEVYRARDERLGRDVAIKVLAPEFVEESDRRARLEREAKTVSALNHPNICTLYDLGREDGLDYLVMEYLEGETLAEQLEAGPLPIDRVLSLGAEVASALDAAHRQGIVHRDLKPGNVMLTRTGAKLLDFGLAKMRGGTRLTRTGTAMGTLAYMPPEQVLGKPVDQRADLWALGVVLWEMLTGRRGFAGDNEGAVVHAVLNRVPEPASSIRPGLPPGLDAVLERALAKDPEARYATAAELLADLAAAEGSASAPERQPTAVWDDAVTALRPPEPEPPPAPANALAVLDFANLALDPDADWLCGGIAESITVDLKKVAALSVVDRRRILAAAAGQPQEPSAEELAALGRAFGARWLVTGAFQKLGTALRLTARCYDTVEGREGSQVRLDGSMDEIFALQDRLIGALVEALDLGVGDAELSLIGPQTGDLEAYEHCARGRRLINEMSPDSLAAARTSFEKAIEIDPRYALAHAGLGQLGTMRYIAKTDPQDLETAIRHLQKAVELDPELGDPYCWLTYAYGRLDRFDEALESGRRAVALEPDHPYAHYFHAVALWLRAIVGHRTDGLGEAVRHLRRISTLAPRYQPGYQVLGDILLRLGFYDEARPPFERAAEIEASGDFEMARFVGAHAGLGTLELRLGRTGEAIDRFRRSLAILGETRHVYTAAYTALTHAGIGDARLHEGRADEAMASYRRARELALASPRALGIGWVLIRAHLGLAAAFRRLLMTREAGAAMADARRCHEERGDLDFSGLPECGDAETWFLIARYEAAAGRAEEAIAALEQAVECGWLELPRLLAEPAFRPLLEDARLRDLQARLGRRREALAPAGELG